MKILGDIAIMFLSIGFTCLVLGLFVYAIKNIESLFLCYVLTFLWAIGFRAFSNAFVDSFKRQIGERANEDSSHE